ncbi:conserved hypothetical protein [uncultured Desulfatiglans sp.]|uniref:Uncharacterized protein n=1 Tax=Uncultured Desulfatiglans sp. TaxID=1748965 RepID=A0A653ADI5_UNCDX|nr:conserved hypothetical protein [uncultured Desulfatiglans sp.]
MTKQISFTKYENLVLPHFRDKLNKAESTEDVKKFFVQSAADLMDKILEGAVELENEDIALLPDQPPHYKISKRLLSLAPFKDIWGESDLARVFERLSESAMNRYRHLQKHPEKTDSKIRM